MIRRAWWALFAYWAVVYAIGSLLHYAAPLLAACLAVVIVVPLLRWMFPPRMPLVDYRRIRYLERELGMTPGPLMAKGAPHATQEIDPTDYRAWQDPPEGWRPGDPVPTADATPVNVETIKALETTVIEGGGLRFTINNFQHESVYPVVRRDDA
jgi:hypothetical protein